MFFQKSENIGYDNFKNVNPKMTIKLMQKKLYLQKFKLAMQRILDFHEPIQKDIKNYVELLCDEAN